MMNRKRYLWDCTMKKELYFKNIWEIMIEEIIINIVLICWAIVIIWATLLFVILVIEIVLKTLKLMAIRFTFFGLVFIRYRKMNNKQIRMMEDLYNSITKKNDSFIDKYFKK